MTEPRSAEDCPPGMIFRRGHLITKGPRAGTTVRATCYSRSAKKTPKDCPEGTYYRRATVTKNGVHRRATCVEKSSKRSINKYLQDYHLNDFVETRFEVLDAAVQKFSAEQVVDYLRTIETSTRAEQVILASDLRYLMLMKILWDQYGYYWNLDEKVKDKILTKMYNELGRSETLAVLDRLKEYRNQYLELIDEVEEDITFVVDQ